jgi:hypothetical protein
MKKWVLAAAAAVGLAGSASAAVLTLESVTPQGGGEFRFSYQGTLGPDEGVRPGDRLIIFDFGGYVDGSIFAPGANVATSVEFTSPTALVTPGFTDDPNIVNLVFTYTGAPFRNEGGPFAPFDFDGLGARSTFNLTTIDAFFTRTTKNNPDNEENTSVFTLGRVQVPSAIPEPATWAMMLGGFGLAGAAMRRRGRMVSVSA